MRRVRAYFDQRSILAYATIMWTWFFVVFAAASLLGGSSLGRAGTSALIGATIGAVIGGIGQGVGARRRRRAAAGSP